MSSIEESVHDETIIKMITELKPNIKSQGFLNYASSTPLKRTLSSTSSNDENDLLTKGSSVAKKAKREMDMFYIGSPREVRRMRADLVDARNTITIAEKRISHMHIVRKELEIMFEHERNLLKSQQEKDRKTIDELEDQLQSIRQREKAMKEENDELKHKLKFYKEESHLQINELESSVANLQDLLDAHNNDENALQTQFNRKLNAVESMYQTTQEELEAQKKLIEDLNKKLKEKQEIESELEVNKQRLAKLQLELKEFQFSKEGYQEFQQQAKMQQYKLLQFADMERENKRLKEETKNLKNEVHNKLILEEEVYDLRNRLVTFKEQEKKLTELQVQHAQTEIYLEEFRNLARTICEISSSASDASLPRQLRMSVERYQQQEINLTAEKINLQSQITAANHEAKRARDEFEKSQTLIKEMQTNEKNQSSLIHRMQKKVALVSGERDSYRKQLDSYERDLTICVTPASAANPGLAQAQSQQERIQSLEKVIDGYRDMVHKLETDLRQFEPKHQTTPAKSQQLLRLQDDLEKLKNENQLLRERKDHLEVQLEEFVVGVDTTSQRIVHNRNNPLAEHLKEREREKEKLKVECEHLKRKIKKLEEGIETSKLGDVTIDHQHVQQLKDQLKTNEQQLARLKDFFKNSMQEFRNIIYMLLGYKIDRTSNSQYKLTSMYADNTGDCLSFYVNKDGTLNLIENAFSSSLEEMVDLHLRHQKSIPVFLSALTMDLFNNKTMTKTYADAINDFDEDDSDNENAAEVVEDEEDDEVEEEEEEEEDDNNDDDDDEDKMEINEIVEDEDDE